jgi:hypothetical protein
MENYGIPNISGNFGLSGIFGIFLEKVFFEW